MTGAFDLLALLTAFSLGFFGSLHCVAMCGGISCGLSAIGTVLVSPQQQLLTLLVYNAGRICSYGLAGLVLGVASHWLLVAWQDLALLLRGIAGTLLIAMGLYIAGLSRLLSRLESLAYRLWRSILSRASVSPRLPSRLWSRLASPGQVLRVQGLPAQGVGGQALTRNSLTGILTLGLLWGWLPCGLVYSTLLWAGSLGAGGGSTAMLMLCFGLGTLPAMLVTGMFGDALRGFARARTIRWLAGFCIVLYGIWTLIGGFGHLGHSPDHGDHRHPLGHTYGLPAALPLGDVVTDGGFLMHINGCGVQPV